MIYRELRAKISPTAQSKYLGTVQSLDWKEMQMLLFRVALDTKTRYRHECPP